MLVWKCSFTGMIPRSAVFTPASRNGKIRTLKPSKDHSTKRKRSRTHSRDHLHLPKIVEEFQKHFLGIYAVVKSGAPNLDGARDVVIFHETENGVSKGPRRNLFVG